MVLDQPRLSLQPTLQRIAQFADLGAAWDSYGAEPPTAKALLEAARLATKMAERFAGVAGQNALPWAVAPLASSGVQLEWKGPKGSFEIEIDPEGRLGYLLEARQGPDVDYQEGDDIADDDAERMLTLVLGMGVG